MHLFGHLLSEVRKEGVVSKRVVLADVPRYQNGGAPKELRRGRAEKRLSKKVFLESPFLLRSLKVFRTFQVF